MIIKREMEEEGGVNFAKHIYHVLWGQRVTFKVITYIGTIRLISFYLQHGPIRAKVNSL